MDMFQGCMDTMEEKQKHIDKSNILPSQLCENESESKTARFRSRIDSSPHPKIPAIQSYHQANGHNSLAEQFLVTYEDWSGEREKPNYVSFGSTHKRRPIFPVDVPPTRFGNEMKSIYKDMSAPGPGAHEKENQTNFQYQIDHYLTSKKGYTMGARTGPRFRTEFIEETPAPPHYQTTCTDLRLFDPAYKPFNVSAQRFPVTKRDIVEANPGPGNYEHEIERNRQVQWHQSFGSAPIKLPDVKVKSTIGSNTAKLLSTRDAKKHHRRLAYLKLYWD